jgi:hypothetical protein
MDRFHSAQYKYHVEWPRTELGPPRCEDINIAVVTRYTTRFYIKRLYITSTQCYVFRKVIKKQGVMYWTVLPSCPFFGNAVCSPREVPNFKYHLMNAMFQLVNKSLVHSGWLQNNQNDFLMPWIPCIFVQLHLDPTKCTTFIIEDLKLFTIYRFDTLQIVFSFLKFYPTCFGASFAPSSGVSLNQISCLVGLLLCMLCSCWSVVLFVGPYPTVVIHCWCPACVLSRIYPASICIWLDLNIIEQKCTEFMALKDIFLFLRAFRLGMIHPFLLCNVFDAAVPSGTQWLGSEIPNNVVV